jgi:hypothetical protein
MKRANWIGAPEMFNLNMACRSIVDAFGWHVYLVGSAMERRDHRDVDVRCILDDEEFDSLFPGPMARRSAWLDSKNSLLSSAISEWLSVRTGLKIDFQFQRSTEANAEYGGRPRSALGIFVTARSEEAPAESPESQTPA